MENTFIPEKFNRIEDAIKNQKDGYYIGSRLVLPFHCELIKVEIGDEHYTEFVGSENIKISQDPQNTSIYFRVKGRLFDIFKDMFLIEDLTKSEKGSLPDVIHLTVCEIDADICEQNTHIRLACTLLEDNYVKIIKK